MMMGSASQEEKEICGLYKSHHHYIMLTIIIIIIIIITSLLFYSGPIGQAWA